MYEVVNFSVENYINS